MKRAASLGNHSLESIMREVEGNSDSTKNTPVEDSTQELNNDPLQIDEQANEQQEVSSPEPVSEQTIDPNITDVTPKVIDIDTSATSDVKQNSSATENVSEPVEPMSSPKFSDQDALSYLSEKLGRPISSLEDLQPKSNPLDNDPYLKDLYEWRQRTGRPIEDFAKYQKDYNQVSDLDVAREFLQHKYSSFTPEEIQMELSDYMPDETDLDSDIARKNLKLKKLAIEGREALNSLKADLTQPTNNLSPEVQQALDFSKQVQQQKEEHQKFLQEYNQQMQSAALKTDSVQLKLSDDLVVNYKVSDDTKKNIPNYVNEMPHWRRADGSMDHAAVAKDGVKIKHFDEMIKIAYEQGINAGKEKLSKEVNNITLDKTNSTDTQLNNKGGVQIEGLDKFFGRRGMR